MIKQINLGNYYFLNVLDSFKQYYEKQKINIEYTNFINSNFITLSKNQLTLTKRNIMKFSLLSKYFQIIDNFKLQNKIFNNTIEIKNGLIKIEEKQILIQNILNSESLYQKELLKLMDRSIAENIIVYLINKFPLHFKNIDLNLNIYTDIKNYYKEQKDKLEEFEKKNSEKIDKINDGIVNINGLNNIKKNAIIFEKPIKIGKTSILEIKELNQMLEFLFYIKSQGNFTDHPKDSKIAVIKPDKHKFQIPKNYDDIKQLKEYIEKLLKNEFMKKFFIGKAKPKKIIECLFYSKFKPLIASEDYEEMNNKIDAISNELLGELNGVAKNDKIFVEYKEKLKELEILLEELKESGIGKKKLLMSPLLNEFFERTNKIVENEKKCLPFLFKLNNGEYETSITGDNNTFFSFCLDYIIKKLIPKLDDEIDKYQTVLKNMENLILLKDQLIYLLKHLGEKLNKLEEFSGPVIDSKEMNEYVNKNMNNLENENIDIIVIRKNLEKLITEPFDWTQKKNCDLTTLLFLAQNKN